MIPICDDCKWWRDYSEPYEMQQHPDYDGHCTLLGIMTLGKTECEHLNEELHLRESVFNDHPNELIESDFVSSPWTKWKEGKMRDEIKPVRCGCGGEANIVFPFMHTDIYLIECNNCGICTSSYNTEAEAITAWNRAMGVDEKCPHCGKLVFCPHCGHSLRGHDEED